MNDSRAGTRLATAWLVAIAALHAWGAIAPGAAAWGFEHFAYLGAPARLAVLAAVALAVLAARGAAARPRTNASEAGPSGAGALAVPFALALAGGALFGALRVSHLLLGDGAAIVHEPPVPLRLDPFEPLGSLATQFGIRAHAALTGARPDDWRAAWSGAALASTAFGALWTPLSWALARRAVAPAGERARSLAVPAFAALVFQGYALLVCGYVENYAFELVALTLFAFAFLGALDGAGTAALAGLAFALALLGHFSALATAPGCAALGVVPARRGRARDAALGAGAAIAAIAIAGVALARWSPGYDLPAALARVSGLVASRSQEVRPNYLLSPDHVRDLANVIVLVGPLGVGLATLLLGARALRGPRDAEVASLAALLVPCAAALAIAGDSNLGYARNWDVLAAQGVLFTAAALRLLARAPATARRTALFAALAALSVFHTGSWIASQRSESSALAWFERLPLGLGRTESTLGWWHRENGRTREAEWWLARSLDAYPANVRAHVHLGELYVGRGDFRRAALAFDAAVELRPDRADFRLRRASAHLLAGDPPTARADLLLLAREFPDDARVAAALALAEWSLGESEDAASAMARAGALGSAAADSFAATGFPPREHPDFGALHAAWIRLVGLDRPAPASAKTTTPRR